MICGSDLRDYPGFVEWLPRATYLAVKTMVCGSNLGVNLTFKNLNVLKCFELGKCRIKMALCKLAQKIH
jgi:hypothetical protein